MKDDPPMMAIAARVCAAWGHPDPQVIPRQELLAILVELATELDHARIRSGKWMMRCANAEETLAKAMGWRKEGE